MAMLRYERDAWKQSHPHTAGIDEAGRGPLAGPVVAAAVIFNPDWIQQDGLRLLDGLTDSKKLTEAKREHYYHLLFEHTAHIQIGIGESSPVEIDHLNILRATHQAMARAVQALPAPLPTFALVDGLPVKGLPIPHLAIVKGDSASLSIAAASVIAKVTRDRHMTQLAAQYPHYGFDRHKGYGTAEHLDALKTHGPCPAHRRSFAPVSQGTLF